jgi:ketosteroid isomerase-like protein
MCLWDLGVSRDKGRTELGEIVDEWIDGFVSAWNSHDAEAISGFMTDDAEFVHWGDTGWATFDGREKIAAWIEGLNSGWSSDHTLEKTFAFATEHAFAIEYTETGTADLGSDPPGRRFALRSAFVGELRAGKISRITDYSDMTAYSMQVYPPSPSNG